MNANGSKDTNSKFTAFLDRDGVINEAIRGRWVNSVKDLKVYPYAAEAIRMLNEAGAEVIVITNQSGVASGKLPHHEYYAITAEMLRVLDQDGAKITRVYECLHSKNPVDCMCRKPDAGMLYRAIEDYPTLLPRFLVGDCASDIETAFRALNASIKPIMVMTGLNNDDELTKTARLAERYGKEFWIEPDLLAACKMIVHSLS